MDLEGRIRAKLKEALEEKDVNYEQKLLSTLHLCKAQSRRNLNSAFCDYTQLLVPSTRACSAEMQAFYFPGKFVANGAFIKISTSTSSNPTLNGEILLYMY